MAKIFKEIKKNKVVFSLLILIFILILGNNLREYQYASVPMPGETADEYSFGWLGISLIKDKYPVAWSGIGAYKTHDHQRINVDNLFDKDPERPLFPINKPWFDHPPLFALLLFAFSLKEFKNTIHFKRFFLLVMFAFNVWLSVLKVYYYCIENWYYVT